jgi:hypothetical protein
MTRFTRNVDRVEDRYHTLAMALFAIATLTLAAHAQSPSDAPAAGEPAAAEAAAAEPVGAGDAAPGEKRKEKERTRTRGGATSGGGTGFGGGLGSGGVFGGSGGMMMGPMGGLGGTGMGGRGDTASLLERALRYSPDVQLAEAKLRTAEAELNRARLEVAKTVIGLEHSIASQQRIIELEKVRLQQARESHKRLEDLVKKRLTSASSESAAALALKEAESELISAEAKLSELRETLRYMMGGSLPGMSSGSSYGAGHSMRPLPGGPAPGAGGDTGGGTSGVPKGAESVKPPSGGVSNGKMMWPGGGGGFAIKLPSPAADSPQDNLRRKLQAPTQVQLKEAEARDLAKYLQDLHGVPFLLDPSAVDSGVVVTIDIRDVPLHAALQAVEDTHPDLRFFVRDYGILIGKADSEGGSNKAVRVRDFMQSGTPGAMIKYELGPRGQYIPFYATEPPSTPAANEADKVDSASKADKVPADSRPGKRPADGKPTDSKPSEKPGKP